jgi:hypothetical protein
VLQVGCAAGVGEDCRVAALCGHRLALLARSLELRLCRADDEAGPHDKNGSAVCVGGG